jgi:hypothetical protein
MSATVLDLRCKFSDKLDKKAQNPFFGRPCQLLSNHHRDDEVTGSLLKPPSHERLIVEALSCVYIFP